ncbi:serotonin N-acetyltransferase 2, chloroplastic [Cajanus cajan]|uniref:N-acetyltransferase ycf52 n=1 Tax=Cajanus cajan TaxID=3821 RepID=A0A151R5C4_CAJCA|nr:serotonin N-acetyltransferase 2, chloroplastic [Cajanus cajan]KYP37771.1 putative N-acetyltransferase ycf52 [Cajanus cajan]
MLLRGSMAAPPRPSLRLPGARVQPRSVAVSVASSSGGGERYPLSISDEALESRGFAVRRGAEGLDLEELNAVFVAVGFPRREPERIRVALEHTEAVVWVEQRKTRRAVAFARATGDGVFNAIIWDVVVDPSFQGIGLGKALIERLLRELLSKGISNIALYSEPRVLGFYRPLGFVADPDGIRGMVYSRKQNKK